MALTSSRQTLFVPIPPRPKGRGLLEIYGEHDRFITTLASIAERDGMTQGPAITINCADGMTTVHANSTANAYALFALFEEAHYAYQTTGTTGKPVAVIVPSTQPVRLPESLWSNLWDALHAIRSAGAPSGTVHVVQRQGVFVPKVLLERVSPALRKRIGSDPLTNPSLPADIAAKTNALGAAVLALHTAVRAAAPILTALDAWAQPDEEDAQDLFLWGPKTQGLRLMGDPALWDTIQPVAPVNQARFRHALEHALGHLSTFVDIPTTAWVVPTSSGLLPGTTLEDAARFGVAFVAANTPAFVPGALVPVSRFPKGPWAQVQRLS